MKIEVLKIAPVFKLELNQEEVEAIYRLIGSHIVGAGPIRGVFSGIYRAIDDLNCNEELNLNSKAIQCDADRPKLSGTLYVTGE